jgi:hypothetical protein
MAAPPRAGFGHEQTAHGWQTDTQIIQKGLSMSITQRFFARRVRASLVTTAAAAASVAGLLGMGGVAQASTGIHRTDGWVVETTCTGVSGKITYSPGLLTAKARSVHAVLSGTTSGCSNLFNGSYSGTGTFTAILSGTASVGAENFSGTFTINWPASSGFNPSNGTLGVTDSNGVETISGSVKTGFAVGSEVTMQYVTTGNHGNGTKKHPVTSQTYTNTQALDDLVNTG